MHSIILVVGAHYNYARVPLGFWIQDWFEFSRNHYDRIGHLAQGFIPAILAREILWRKQVLNLVNISTGKRWLFFLTTCFCLAFSAFYELLGGGLLLLVGMVLLNSSVPRVMFGMRNGT